MRNVLESTTIIDHYPAVIDRYFKHRHSIHKGPFHIYIYIYIYTSDYTRSPVGEVPRLSAEMNFCDFSKRRETFLTF